MISQAEINEKASSKNVEDRKKAAQALLSAFSLLPDKEQGWQDLHKLTHDEDRGVRVRATDALEKALGQIPDRTQACQDLHKLILDEDILVRVHAAFSLGRTFSLIPDKALAWEDLHKLTLDEDRRARWSAAFSLGMAFSQVPNKVLAWQDLHKLTQDEGEHVRAHAAFSLGRAFGLIPDKALAWQDLHKLTQDENGQVRRAAAFSLGTAFSEIPNKVLARQDLHRLAQDKDRDVRIYAYHSLGRVSIRNASEADDKNTIRSELEAAVEYFEKSAAQGLPFLNRASFCSSFYRSYLALTFQGASGEEVKRYLAEAKDAIGSSENKKELFGAVENLARALEETQKLKERSIENIQSDLMAYQWYCDQAAEHMAAAEDSAPGAVGLLRKCNPIIEERIGATISGIQKAAREICQVTRGSGTKYEVPGAQINQEAKSLSSEDPIKAFKSSTRIAILLKELCGLLPMDKRGHACEIADEILAEQDLSGRFSKIELATTYLVPNIKMVAQESAIKNIFKANSDTCCYEMGNLFRAIILTALKKEYLAVRAHLDDPKEETHKGTVYEVGKFSANGRVWDVAILEAGRYNERASFEAERAINHFHPNVAIFIGVAGGIHDVSLGDVVAATKVYGYEAGKAKDEFYPTPEVYRSSYILEQRARAVARNADWLKRIKGPNRNPLPNAYVESIAAGPKVVKSTSSATYEFLRSNYNDAIAVEMEGLGFLTAAHANQDVNAIIIRGISDLIDHKDEADSQGYQEIASQNASAFAFEVLARLVFDDESNTNSLGTMKTSELELFAIENVLSKGKIIAGEFFRKEPAWVDFEQGYIVNRVEVDRIIDKLKCNKVQMILGDPASGKSIMLKYIGYKLAQEKKAFFVDFRIHDFNEISSFFEKVTSAIEQPVIILDNIHIHIDECEKLISKFIKTKNCWLIIGARKSINFQSHPKYASVFDTVEKIYIKSNSIADKLIELFLDKKYNFTDYRIKEITANFNNYKNDLWLLSWALIAYKPEKDRVDKNEIYKKIRDSITQIYKKERLIDASNAFFPLSKFYRFDIPIDKNYLINIGLDEKEINELILLREIIEDRSTGFVSLNHSSIANIYSEAYAEFPGLGSKIRGKFKGNEDFKLFKDYLLYGPLNFFRIFLELNGDLRNRRDGLTLLKELINDKDVQRMFLCQIYVEKDITVLAFGILSIKEANESFFSNLIADIDISYIVKLINEEKKLFRLPLFLMIIKNIDVKLSNQIIKSIDMESTANNLIHEDLNMIDSYLMALFNIDQECGINFIKYLINGTTISIILKKFEGVSLFLKAQFIFYAALGSCRFAHDLVSQIDINNWIDGIKTSDDLSGFILYIKLLNTILCELKSKIIADIDLDNLRIKSMNILKKENASFNAQFILSIAVADRSIANKLITNEYTEQFKQVLERSNELNYIALYILWLAYANKEIAFKVISTINTKKFISKVEMEGKVENIENFIMSIAYIDAVSHKLI